MKEFKIILFLNLFDVALLVCLSNKFNQHVLGNRNVSVNGAKFVVRVKIFLNISNQEDYTLCSGTLVNKNTVISAGHCFPTKQPSNGRIEILYGTNHIKNGMIVHASKFIVHPKYRMFNLGSPIDYDFAIIKLKKNIRESSIVKYASIDYGQVRLDTYKVVYGWGWAEIYPRNTESEHLYEFNGHIIEQEESRFIKVINHGSHVWKGDSGGPLVESQTMQVIGIASVVDTECSCSSKAIPRRGGYMHYSSLAFVRKWIQQHLNKQ